MSPSTIHRWRVRSAWYQDRSRRPTSFIRRSRSRELGPRVLASLGDNYGTSLMALCQEVDGAISRSSMHRLLARLGVSRKRLSSKLLGRPSPTVVSSFKENYVSLTSGRLVVSIDECHFSTRISPLYGYSLKGERCVQRHPRGGGWTSFSLLFAICSDGSYQSHIVQGSVNRDLFRSWINNLPFPSGSVLLMDNCSIHHGNSDTFSTRSYIPLYLPPYSPDFQPVELAFSKIKHHFRTLWPHPMGVESAINLSINRTTSSDIMGYFRHTDRCRLAA